MPSTLGDIEARGHEEVAQQDAPLVGGLLVDRAQAPLATSLRPSKAPMVILLLPASRASSTYASCNNQGIGSVVFAHDQEPAGSRPAVVPSMMPAGLIDRRRAGRRRSWRRCVNRRRMVSRTPLPTKRSMAGSSASRISSRASSRPGVQAQRGGFATPARRKGGVVDVDADAGDGRAVGPVAPGCRRLFCRRASRRWASGDRRPGRWRSAMASAVARPSARVSSGAGCSTSEQ